MARRRNRSDDYRTLPPVGPAQRRLEHRRRIILEGSSAWIAPPEYAILRKLEYLRESGPDKHLRDIRFILAATPIDRARVESQVARLGVHLQRRQCRPRSA